MAQTREVVFDDAAMAALEAAELENDISPEEFDADASYAAPPPPIHDGVYWMKFENAGVKVKDSDNLAPFRTSRWSNEQRDHYEVAVKGTIIAPDDPLIDGKTVYMERPARTAVDPKRGNTSAVASFFKDIAGEPIRGLSEAGHAKQLVDLLKGAPMGWGAVQNILRDSEAEMAFDERKRAGTLIGDEKKPKSIYGENKIMAQCKGAKDSAGKFTGAGDHPTTGTRCVARARLVGTRNKDFKPTK